MLIAWSIGSQIAGPRMLPDPQSVALLVMSEAQSGALAFNLGPPLRAIAGVEDRAHRRAARAAQRGWLRDWDGVPAVRRDPDSRLCSRLRRRHAGDRNVPGAAA